MLKIVQFKYITNKIQKGINKLIFLMNCYGYADNAYSNGHWYIWSKYIVIVNIDGNFHPYAFFLYLPNPHLLRQDHLPDEDAAATSGNGQWPPFDRFDTFSDEHFDGNR